MATQAEIRQRIEDIEEILRSGVESVTTDGTSTRVNLDQLRTERNELRRKLTTNKAARPVVSRIDLGRF